MILANRRYEAGQLIRASMKAILAGLVLLLLLWLFWPNRRAMLVSLPSDIQSLFFCHAEEVEGEQFLSGGYYFDGAKHQSDEVAYAGRYSCKLPLGEELQFGFNFRLPNPQPGELYQASVWRNKARRGEDGFLVASAKGEGSFYRSAVFPTRSEGDWELVQVHFSIPLYQPIEEVSIYVYSQGKTVMYFDDLRIEKVGDLKDNEVFVPREVHLELKPEAMQQLRNKEAQARRRGMLVSEEEDWVKGAIVQPQSDSMTKVALRLKGDWLDHLKKDKWSFRVKCRNGQSWNRLRVFSLHTPAARNYLLEWVLHQFFLKEDILTTRYDFVTLALNQKPLGVYALEEHFDKALLEFRHRREGPIFRFSEEGFWEAMDRQMKQLEGIDHDIQQSVRLVETAEIVPFQENKTLQIEVLAQQYELAQTLLDQYRRGLKALDEIFDLDAMARYYAISDVMGAQHGLSWHNQRFYYNPITGRIEPIAYDGFGGEPVRRHSIRGQGAFNLRKLGSRNLDDKFFMDQGFVEQYMAYLYRFSSRAYLDAFMAEIQEGLALREVLLQQEFADYRFDVEKLMHNAQRANLLVLPYNNRSLRTYQVTNNGLDQALQIANTHSLPVEVIGYGTRADKISDTLHQPLLLEGFMPRLVNSITEAYGSRGLPLDSLNRSILWQPYHDQEFLNFQTLTLPANSQYLFLRPLGIDTIFHHQIRPWKAPYAQTPGQQLVQRYPLKAGGAYQLGTGEVYFRKGQHRIDAPIVVPEGYRVIFEAGAELDFVDKALFLSYSPVVMRGNEEQPIRITSSDQSAAGFTVLGASDQSRLHYVRFEDLKSLVREGWALTGAVTFYESNVEISRCEFFNNHCEDALNIIRSNFRLSGSVISDTFADGLDADFCKGRVENCLFQRTTNDGMDVSGSIVMIENCVMDNCQDKGISVGEESDVTILSAEIRVAPIALASKDLSTLLIEEVKLQDCGQGFTAYQKKPEYGGGKIIVKKYEADNVKRLYNIRENSLLQLVDKQIKG
ncbi:MAG: CotH kinase family protein [Bacteroidota bacterium]